MDFGFDISVGLLGLELLVFEVSVTASTISSSLFETGREDTWNRGFEVSVTALSSAAVT